jgi:cardiolipin synthase
VWWLLGVLVVKETVMTVMGLLVIRRTGSVYSASWHGKLATCVLYAVIFTHIVWYGVPQAVSMLLVLAGAASILLSLALYTMEDLKRIREGRPQ